MNISYITVHFFLRFVWLTIKVYFYGQLLYKSQKNVYATKIVFQCL